MVRVQDLQAVDELDVASVDDPRALLVDADGVRLRGRRLEDDLFEVEDDLGHVFDDVADGRELVERAVDAKGRDRRALERREEDAAQRVADGDSVAALERLGGELAVELRERLGLDVNAARANEIAPVASDDVRGAHALSSLQVGSRDGPGAPSNPLSSGARHLPV